MCVCGAFRSQRGCWIAQNWSYTRLLVMHMDVENWAQVLWKNSKYSTTEPLIKVHWTICSYPLGHLSITPCAISPYPLGYLSISTGHLSIPAGQSLYIHWVICPYPLGHLCILTGSSVHTYLASVHAYLAICPYPLDICLYYWVICPAQSQAFHPLPKCKLLGGQVVSQHFKNE